MLEDLLYEKIIGKGVDLVERRINRLSVDNKRCKLWEKAFLNVAKYSEKINDSFCIELSKHRTLRRFFYLTFDTDSARFPVDSFIIALAMELKDYNIKLSTKDIIGVGEAIIQMWKQVIVYSDEADSITCFNDSIEIYKDSLIGIINSHDNIIRSFYKDLEDPNGLDKIRVYYPATGKNYIEWKQEYSIDICVNMHKGMPLGFTRIGYDYYLLENQPEQLKLSYISEDSKSEIMRVHTFDFPDDERRLIWVY
ncbi:hypothetical protein [Anaeromicropila herbilytica]|uniref:Uncharacterized protein n=1 Tax=Anaeromicropila herbilytica TaxID=2785025 RepID=A0A7R7IDP0_9FIRM|nr:hypothetical protein [Anaeromicropila herbilytica]BCN31923.1 hypothetical protein bsdtb5_32180 [Anaeromicropila herbilytica]